ncbi:hypothetical protein D3C75_1092140 [compost metagenome]
MNFQVAQRMVRYALAALAVTPDSKRNLLRHRAAGEKHRRFLAQHLRHFSLKLLNQLARTVHITGQAVLHSGKSLF